MHALQGWTHSKMIDNLLHCWVTPLWQHHALKKFTEDAHCKTGEQRGGGGTWGGGREAPVLIKLYHKIFKNQVI